MATQSGYGKNTCLMFAGSDCSLDKRPALLHIIRGNTSIGSFEMTPIAVSHSCEMRLLICTSDAKHSSAAYSIPTYNAPCYN